MKNRQDLSRRDFIRKSMMAGSAMFLSGILPINGKGMREFMSSCNNESELVYSDDMLKGICDIHLHAAPDSKARLKNELEFTQDAKNAGYKALLFKLNTRVRDNILKSKEQKNIQPTKGGHKMVTCQNYVSLFYCQITSCPSDGGIS